MESKKCNVCKEHKEETEYTPSAWKKMAIAEIQNGLISKLKLLLCI